MKLSRYRADIDGLRAIAILSVIFFHTGLKAFSGGYVGVDVFFVISGFLITRLIYDEIKEGKFSFTNFYVRRVRRLLPALFFSLAVCFIAAIFLFSPRDLARFSSSLLSAIFSVSNIYFWRESGYFAEAAELKPLLHTWSLGVEEQFYLIWPMAMVFLLTKAPKWALPTLLIVGGAFSLLLNINFANRPEVIFYLAPFRAFEFAIGAIMVWFVPYQPKNKLLLEPLVLGGLALIAYPVFTYTESTVFPSVNALIPCIGAAFIIYGATAKYSGRLLSNPLAVGIGLISYSLYLIHWPIFVFYKYYKFDELTQIEIYAICAVSLIVAALMYRFVEQPFRRGASIKRLSPFAIGIVCAVCAATLAIPAIHAYNNNGWEWRINNYVQFKNENPLYGGEGFDWIGFYGKNKKFSDVILYGDSHAKQYLYGLNKEFNKSGLTVEVITHSACISFPSFTNIYQGRIHPSCIQMLQRIEKSTEENKKPVILAFSWEKKLATLDGEEIKFETKDQKRQFLLKGIDEFIEAVGPSRNFIIIGNNPGTNTKNGYLQCAFRPHSLNDCTSKYKLPIGDIERREFNSDLKKFAESRSNVYFIDPFDVFCHDGECFTILEANIVYSDHAHLSQFGSGYFAEQLDDKIRGIIAQ